MCILDYVVIRWLFSISNQISLQQRMKIKLLILICFWIGSCLLLLYASHCVFNIKCWFESCFVLIFLDIGLHWDFIQNRFFFGLTSCCRNLIGQILALLQKFLLLGHICIYIFFCVSHLIICMIYNVCQKGDIICFGAYWEDTSQHTNAFVLPFFLVS